MQDYWPQSGLRLAIILLLLASYPAPLATRELIAYLPDYNKEAIKKALHDLYMRGIIVRIARGLYTLSTDYVSKYGDKLNAMLKDKEGYLWLQKVTYVTNLTYKQIVERILYIVDKRYPGKLNTVDYRVIEALAWIALKSSSPYVQDHVGLGLARVLQERSSSILGGFDTAEIAESIKYMASLGIIYIYPEKRKMRLDSKLLEEARMMVGETWHP